MVGGVYMMVGGGLAGCRKRLVVGLIQTMSSPKSLLIFEFILNSIS